MKFCLQTIGGEIQHDFVFSLKQVLDVEAWLHKCDKNYFYSENALGDCIPVGSIDYVLNSIKTIKPKPINIPKSLYKYAGRKCFVGKYSDCVDVNFVAKSSTQFKKGPFFLENESIPEDEDLYFFSEIVDIISEWRIFVFNNKVLDAKNYDGRFDVFPDFDVINKIVSDYKDCSPAYTLDVYINNKGTFVMEVHDFFSCGLYGFSNKNLPAMFSQTYLRLK